MNISSDYFLYINIAIVLIYIFFIVIGYIKGFLFELVSLAYTFLSGVIAWLLSPVFAGIYPLIKIEESSAQIELLNKFINIDNVLNTAIYFVIIFLVLKLFYVVLAFVLKGINKIPVIGKFNQILGAIAGIINATLVSLVLSILLTLPIIKNGQEVKDNTIFKYIDVLTNKVLNSAINNMDIENIKDDFQELDAEKIREEFKNWLNIKNDGE